MVHAILTKRYNILFFLLLVLLFVFELSLGRCLQEDAFISFRYAQNLVEGHGLVYNPGERVEGYTNFLWTMMIAAAMQRGIDPIDFARYAGMLCSLILVLVVYLVSHRHDTVCNVTGGLIAAAIVAANPSIGFEGVQGMETIFFSLLVTAGVLLGVQGRSVDADFSYKHEWRIIWSTLILFLAALTRPEGLGVFCLVTIAALLWAFKHNHATCLRWECLVLVMFVTLYAPYWTWRYNYYGWLFPNTFYAKTGGGLWHVVRGIKYELQFLVYNPVIGFLTFWGISCLFANWRRQRRHRKLLSTKSDVAPLGLISGGVIIGYLIYVIIIGGDFKPSFRFIIPVLPLWAVMLDLAISRFGWPFLNRCIRLCKYNNFFTNTQRTQTVFAMIFLAAVVFNAGFSLPAIIKKMHVAAWDLTARKACGLWLAENAPKGSVLAIHSAGIIPFYSKLYTIDMWGINDVHIAHKKMPNMGRVHPVGHEKNDPVYVFSRKPTHFIDEWTYVTKDLLPSEMRWFRFKNKDFPQIRKRYRERSVPLMIDDGSGLQRYWFNFLTLVK